MGRPIQTYQGSCHCGAVRYEIKTDFPELTTCDCSICRRKNALMVKVHESEFKLLAGEESLTLYQFHTHTAKHYFCKVCGIYPFHRKRVAPDYVGVNVFCLEDFDPTGIPVRATVGAGMKKMKLSYRLVNVFTHNGGRLTGNPLCVFEDGSDLNTEQMQALALQFNLSETTFITASDKANARVRIFTPSYEMPFAGHPTLGTSHVVRSLMNTGDKISLELNVGVIPVEAHGSHWELHANVATTRKPTASSSELAAALGLQQGDVMGPALWVNSGSEQLIVPLASEDAVRRVKISFDALSRVTKDGPRAQAYVFAPTGKDTLLSRFFFSKGESLLEDPATGSATANLGGWYLANNASLPLTKTISQGQMAGRPSTLRLRIDAERNVFVAGEVVELGAGYVDI